MGRKRSRSATRHEVHVYVHHRVEGKEHRTKRSHRKSSRRRHSRRR